MNRLVCVVVISAITVAAFACSSSTSGTNSASTNCLAAADNANASCVSCVEANCASQLSTLETDCADFVGCACPGGTYSASAATAPACVTKQQESACQTANSNVGSCATTSCSTQCNGAGST